MTNTHPRDSFRLLWGLLAVSLLLALAAPREAQAQVLYGSVVGNVTDPNGGLVPGASVTVTNQGTGIATSGTTNAAGEYSFGTLQPGVYTLKVSLSGFKTFQRHDLSVEANNVIRTDVKLEVGNVQQSITVAGEAPVLQTDRAETHVDVSSPELVNLPIPLGRNYQQIYATLPGFSQPFNSHSIPTNPARSLEFHVNGTSDDQNNTRIDGVSSYTVQLPHIVSYIPALESIQEVNVVSGSFNAEQGFAGGAAINVQIKSGTNQFHGSLFEYHNDQHLEAWPEAVPPGQVNKPKAVYNQGGGTIGGPIKKDKLFFFASYEGTFDHRNVQKKVTVPTDAMKAGDFSQFLPTHVVYNPYTDNTGTTLADPALRQPFPGNIIPKSLLQTPGALIAAKILPLWPEPNLPGVKNNYFASGPFAFNRDTIDSKVNWNISSKANMFWRFGYLHYTDSVPTIFGDKLLGRPIGGSSNPGHGSGATYSSTFGATYTFTPTLVMDAYFGFTRQGTNSEQPGLGTNIGATVLGIPGTNGTRKFESGWPEFDFNCPVCDGDFNTVGINTNFMPYYRHDPQYQYEANFSWIHNKHNVRFGTDIYRMGLNQTQAEWIGGGTFYGAQGGFDFGQGTTANSCLDPPACTTSSATNRGNSFASFLLGLSDTAGKSLQFPDVYHIRVWLLSSYIQDRWNVTPNLTVNYGVRWEYFPYPTRLDRGLERYDPTINKVLLCGVGGVSGNCDEVISAKRFSPHVGFAWRARNSFVVRAGYGLTNDPYEGLELLRNNYPIMEPFGIQTPNSFVVATSLAQGIPSISAPVIPSNGILDIPLDVGFEGYPKDLHRGYIQSWNFTLQKELGWGFTGQAGYIGTRSIRQLGFVNINAGQVPFTGTATEPLFQQWGRTAATTFLEPLGTGHYDSLQATLQRRFTQGLMLNVNYTWGKAINVVEASSGTPNIQALNYLRMNRSPTNYDTRHNLAITNVWELPFGRRKKYASSKGLLTPIVSDWQVNNVFRVISGFPFNVSGDCSANWPSNSPTMTNIYGSPKKIGNQSGYWYDPLAFGETFNGAGNCLTGSLGSSGFNNLIGPGVFNWDFGVFREFSISERFKLQFRLESFNFTNTPHFGGGGTNSNGCTPDNFIGDANALDPNTGRVTDPGAFMTLDNGTCDLAREGIDQRQFRIGLRLSF